MLLFVFTAMGVFSLGRKEKMNDSKNSPILDLETIDKVQQSDAADENIIKIIGRIIIYGNEPHTYAGIIDENGIEYAVYPPSKEEELRKLEGHLIEFTVILLDKPQGYGGLFLRGGSVTPVKWELLR